MIGLLLLLGFCLRTVVGYDYRCRFCGAVHATRNLLFQHLRDSSPCVAAAATENPAATGAIFAGARKDVASGVETGVRRREDGCAGLMMLEVSARESVEVAAQLVSYKSAEDSLALAAAGAGLSFHALNVRGQFERENATHSREDDHAKNIVAQFLAALSMATTHGGGSSGWITAGAGDFGSEYARRRGLDVAARLAEHARGVAFAPPSRSLVGLVCCRRSGRRFDVALTRDRAQPQSRFSLVLSCDRAKGAKVARVLAEMEDGEVYVRGAEVLEGHRGQGLSRLVLATVAALCLASFGRAPRTRPINKPLLALSLSNLGFTAESEGWPVLVGRAEPNGDTPLCPADPNDTRNYFANSVLRKQKIKLVQTPPHDAKRAFINTEFKHTDPRSLAQHIESTADLVFFSARLLAFCATLDTLRPHLYHCKDCAGT